jgi:hypothetical protein
LTETVSNKTLSVSLEGAVKDTAIDIQEVLVAKAVVHVKAYAVAPTAASSPANIQGVKTLTVSPKATKASGIKLHISPTTNIPSAPIPKIPDSAVDIDISGEEEPRTIIPIKPRRKAKPVTQPKPMRQARKDQGRALYSQCSRDTAIVFQGQAYDLNSFPALPCTQPQKVVLVELKRGSGPQLNLWHERGKTRGKRID